MSLIRPDIALAEKRKIYSRAETYNNVLRPSSATAGRVTMARVQTPSIAATSRSFGGTALSYSSTRSIIPRSASTRSIIPRSASTRTGVIPASTLVPSAASTGSVFGGVNGGVGPATTLPTPLGPSTLTNFSSSVSKAGTSIMNSIETLIPLAIKVILAIIVIKIVLWLVKGKR